MSPLDTKGVSGTTATLACGVHGIANFAWTRDNEPVASSEAAQDEGMVSVVTLVISVRLTLIAFSKYRTVLHLGYY